MKKELKLRPYQEKGVDEIREQFAKKIWPVLFVLSTGGGKTITFSYIADCAAKLGRPVCILVHRKELLLQASKTLHNLGIDHGLISPHFSPDNTKLIQIASVDTILIRLKKHKYKFGLIIFDEAHHCQQSNKWGRVYEQLGKQYPMLGVTATPVRGDGKGMGEHAGGLFKVMVQGPSIVELMAMGMLVNPTVYTSLEQPDYTGLKKNKDGDLNAEDLALRIDKPKITGSAVKHYTEICPGAPAVAFCCNVKHATHVAEEFCAAGYKFELLVGQPYMTDAERTSVNQRLAAGEIDGVCTVDLISEGYDVPALKCCIMLRYTESEGLFLQQVGRVERPTDDGAPAFLLDHVGNVGKMVEGVFIRKHGLPDEVRRWSLDGRVKRKKNADLVEEEIKLKQCPKCFHVHEPRDDNKCPKCGYEYPVVGPRQIEQVEGTLTVITAEMAEAMKRKDRFAQANAKTIEEMVENLGFSAGRAAKIVEARAEKEALRVGIIFEMTQWQRNTGQMPFDAFGIMVSDIKQLKPKALKELRDKIDAVKAEYEKTGLLVSLSTEEELF